MMSDKYESLSIPSFTRRDFLKAGGFGLAGLALFGAAGCSAPGASGSKLTIGAILSFSGTFAPLSEDIRDGLNLYFEQNNNSIGGRQVEVKYEDDAANPQTALRKYSQLRGAGIEVFAGIISSPVAVAVRDRVDADKMLYIDSNAAANALSWQKRSDYVYRVSFSNWQNGSAGASYLARNVGKTAFTIAADYPAGREVIAAFTSAYQAAGGKVVNSVFPPLGANDYATYVTQMAQAKPDIVFGFLAGQDAIRFVKQYQSFGLKDKIQLTGTAEFGDPLVIQAAKESVEGIIATVFYSPEADNAANQKFAKAYRDKYNKTPSMFSVDGYDTGQVIAQAVQKAGSVKPADLIKALPTISIESPRGPFRIDPATNNPVQNYYAVKLVKRNNDIVQETLETIKDVRMPASPPA